MPLMAAQVPASNKLLITLKAKYTYNHYIPISTASENEANKIFLE